jgi:NADP-dependent 3-hydroxy acid dehydrogenase YdfG
MTAAALDALVKSGRGHIVNMGSLAGVKVIPGGAVYCATKAAVRTFSEGLRMELGPKHGIRVVCIEPGMTLTNLWSTIDDKGVIEMLEGAKKAMGQPFRPEDIADVIAFCVTRPAHVNLNEIVLRPTRQAN